MNGFTPVTAEYYHCGTDVLGKAVLTIYKLFAENKNITFHFNTLIVNLKFSHDILFSSLRYVLLVKNNADNIVTPYSINEGDKVIFAVGRYGANMLNDMIITKDMKKGDSYVDLGIRYEFPAFITELIDKIMYLIKCSYETKSGLNVRLFCQNPSGYVVKESYKYNNDELYTVNGHSKNESKSLNTNLAILVRHKFTLPFDDSFAYGSAIAKLANMLGGSGKVILQTYGDLINGKRTKKIGRTIPTMDINDYIKGDLNFVLPSKTKEAIILFIENFNKVIPGFNQKDNLCYGVLVKFYSAKRKNSDNIYYIGDCSGLTRSIIKAYCHGEDLALRIKHILTIKKH